MRVVVRKWGNSASVRIPASIMEAAHLAIDQPVEVREEDGRVIIEPVLAETFNLTELLAAITDHNIHEEIDFGPPMGKELL